MTRTVSMRPQTGSGKAEQELDKVQEQVDRIQDDLKKLTTEEISKAPMAEQEPQTLLSKKEERSYDAPKLKPTKMFTSAGQGKELKPEWRAQYNRDWEYVRAVAENYELIGEKIECWTGKWPCDPVYFWEIPVNKPVYMPRFLAEHLSTRNYHRFKMQDRNQYLVQNDMHSENVAFQESLVAKETIKRLGCVSDGFGF